MPELPEVETVVRGVRSQLLSWNASKVHFYRNDLRFPIPKQDIRKIAIGATLKEVSRRSKYILLHFDSGILLIHLGMTGSLRIQSSSKPTANHTHVIFSFSGPSGSQYLHYIDPRRFGYMDMIKGHDLNQSKHLAHLGVEPLASKNLGGHLLKTGSSKTKSIKSLIMDASVVVGIGNIYACEALFLSGIHPERACNSISKEQYQTLARNIKKTLKAAIKRGGTTLRDFQNLSGNFGYFKQELSVYGRTNEACHECGNKIQSIKQLGRTSWFCSHCQL